MTTTINGRTPEEIKLATKICATPSCVGCSYIDVEDGCSIRNEDALALIQQLEAERDQYKRERDAAYRRSNNVSSL